MSTEEDKQMPRYLIEIPHADEHEACVRALHALDTHGSHFVTHAEFGCRDGAHSGWLTVEADSRADAACMVPPEFRRDARIVKVETFTREDIRNWAREVDAVG